MILKEFIWRIKLSDEFQSLSKTDKEKLRSVLKVGSIGESPPLKTNIKNSYESSKRFRECTYQLKVTLNGSFPPIWRRVLVSNKICLHRLHEVFQVALGWEDAHFYHFNEGDTFFIIPDDEITEGIKTLSSKTIYAADQVLLGNVLKEEEQRITYTYDFDNKWTHTVQLEKIDKKIINNPKCISGKRGAPLENCGGIQMYQQLLKYPHLPVYANDPRLSYYINLLRTRNPEYFDQDRINQRYEEFFSDQ